MTVSRLCGPIWIRFAKRAFVPRIRAIQVSYQLEILVVSQLSIDLEFFGGEVAEHFVVSAAVGFGD